MMRVLVCGGRDFGNTLQQRELMLSALNDLRHTYTYPYDPCGKSAKCYMEVITGAASGADQFASRFAIAFQLKLHEFPADWSGLKKAAGPIRNQRMIDEGKPDLVVAFPGGRGTADMIRRAKKAGVPVRTFSAQIQPHELKSAVNEK